MSANSNQLGLGLGFAPVPNLIEIHEHPDPESGPIFVCLDIETTGFREDEDEIIEVAAVKFNKQGKIATLQTLIHTDVRIPLIVQELTNIKNEMLEGKPKLEAIRADLIEFCQDYPIIGHNINFDLNFLDANNIKLPGKRLDTFPLSQMLINYAPSYSLETLSHHFTSHQPSHRALDDVLANIELFDYLSKLWEVKQNSEAKNILEKSGLAFRDHFLTLTSNSKHELKELAPPAPNPDPNLSKVDLEQKPQLIVCTETQIQLLAQEHEDLEVIAPHYQTIESNKLATFLEQETMSNVEALLAMKILINKREDKLPKLSDLNLFDQEYSLSQQLSQSDPIPLQLDNKLYAISHNYFFQLLGNSEFDNNCFKETPITFIDHPFLEEAFVRANTQTIHYNNHRDTGEIAFGLLGIFWTAFTNENFNGPLIVSDEQITSNEWQKAATALSHIGINMPDANERLIWLTKGRDKPPTIQSISKTLSYDLGDLGQDFGLDITMIPYEITTVKPINNYTKLAAPNQNGYFTQLIQTIDHLVQKCSEDICIIATNHEQIKNIYKHLVEKTPNHTVLAQKITGSAGKIYHKLTELNDKHILICTYQFFLKHKPPLPKLEQLILTKLPIITPNHPYYKMQEGMDPKYFNNFVIPHTVKNLLHTIEVGNHAEEINLLDSRLVTTRYGQTISEQLSEYLEFQEIN